MTRVLETVLTGRNLLSPVLAKAGSDVVAFNSTVAGANTKAAASATSAAAVQDRAADKIATSNVKASTSAKASTQAQMRAHTQAAQSATVSARVQEAANGALVRSNGLLGTSLTPLTAGLGATALALGYAAYSGMEFDKSMSRAQAASQASGAELERLRRAALAAGADTQYSATEAAAGITEMSKAGVSTADVLGGGLKGALNLAAAGEMEVADAAEIGATALNVFKLEGKQMSHVADLLAAGAGKAQGSVHDLGMALNQSALVASATGLSIEETTGTLAMFASAGLIGSDAGTSFRSMLLHLQNPSKEAAGVMADLGVNMYDANGAFVGMDDLAGQLSVRMRGLTQAERDKAMATIFGSDAVRAANILYAEGAAGVEEWTGKVNDAGYAAKQASDLNNNLAGDLEKLGGAVKTVFTEMGQGAQGPLREVVQALTFLVNVGGDVIGFFTSLPGPVQAALVALTAVHVLGGPVANTIKGISFAVDVMTASFRNAGGAAGVLKGGAAGLLGVFGGPWGLAITGAAVGLSLLVSWLGRADDATEGATDAQTSLADALRASKGAIDANVRATAAKAAQDEGILDAMEAAGLSTELVTDAILGQGNAYGEVMGKLVAYRDAHTNMAGVRTEEATAIVGTIDVLAALSGQTEGSIADAQQLARATGETGAAMAGSAVQTEEARQALEDWLEQVQTVLAGFVDPLDVYKGLLDEKTEAERTSAEATAAATESSADSWKDYVGDVGVSLDEYATKLEEQLLAQENWRINIATITQRGGLEVGQILFAMGEEGVDLAAQMANGTDAEFQRMAALMVEDTRRGGAGAAAEFDTAMKVMAEIGAQGGAATATAVAQKLGMGLTEVRNIAAQYGVELATGLEPLMAALGQRNIALRARGGGMANLWSGGYTGDGGKYEPKGVVHGGEYVLTKEQTSRLGIDRIEEFANRGYANGGFVTAADVPKPRSTAPYAPPVSSAGDATMNTAYLAAVAWMREHPEAVMGGTAGSGAVTGQWMSLWNLVKTQIPAARINSTFRPGDPGYHGRNKAIDFGFGSGPGGAGSAGLASINRLLHDQVGRNLAELIYDGIGDDRPDLKHGRPLTYSAATRAQHANHVHAAVADTGGIAQTGTALLNLSGRPERMLDPRQTEAFERWMQVAPASMPGYGMAGGGGGGQQVVVVEKRTQVDVDARGFNADQIADKVVRRQADKEWLTSG